MPHKEIIAQDPDEILLYEIKRHPIGLVPIILLGIGMVVAVFIAIYFVALSENSLSAIIEPWIMYAGLGLVAFLAAFLTYIAIDVYRTSVLAITNESLIIITQISLLSRSVSQLNLSKIQDVNVDQKGILDQFFDFGNIFIETAGEAKNFQFPTATKPIINAKRIIEAHEEYIEKTHSSGSDGI